jgi:hypothetical protein
MADSARSLSLNMAEIFKDGGHSGEINNMAVYLNFKYGGHSAKFKF